MCILKTFSRILLKSLQSADGLFLLHWMLIFCALKTLQKSCQSRASPLLEFLFTSIGKNVPLYITWKISFWKNIPQSQKYPILKNTVNFWTWLSFTSVPRCGFLKSFSFRGRGAHPTRTMCKFQNSEGSPVLLMLSLLHYRRSRRKEVVNLSPGKVNFWGTFYLSNWMKMERKPRELASNCFCNCGAKSLWSFFSNKQFCVFCSKALRKHQGQGHSFLIRESSREYENNESLMTYFTCKASFLYMSSLHHHHLLFLG